MSLLFGGGGKKVKPQFTGLSAQTSTTTVPVTQSWGYGRQAPNLIWQGDFEAHKQKQKSGKGMGGSSTTYTYSASFLAAVGWGPFSGCDRVWKDQSKETDFTKLGFSLFDGTIPQAPWGYLVTAHPTQALGYPGIGYFAVANYDLGQSNTFPQHSFEMRRPLYDTAPGGVGDADIALIIDDFLNSDINGVIIDGNIDTDSLMSGPDAGTTGDNAMQTYCTAMGFGMSPELESQETATEILQRWCDFFNTMLIWTGYSLKFRPWGTDTVTANGVTYLPDFASRYTLTDDDFVFAEGDDPIRMRRMSPQDVKNSLSLEFKNRDNEYNIEPAPWQDQGLIDQYGPKPDGSTTAHEIKVKEIALTCAALMGQRKAYVRNSWDFELPVSYMLLEPGDVVTCVDPRWGTFEVIITEAEEQDNDDFSFVVEEYNGSVNSSGPTQNGGGIDNNPIDTGVTAGPVNPPMIFQPPPTLTSKVPQIWAAVSGGDGTNDDPNWGGCDVYLSTDGGTSYNMVGTIDAPARMGKLNAALAAIATANPDVTNTLKTNTAMSDAEFTSATAVDAAAGVTLCRIAPEGANVEEYLAYQTAALNTTDVYWFTNLYRGLHASVKGAHAVNAPFARLDNESIFKYTFPLSFIGETIYIKFVSFNIYNSGYQDLADAVAYSITILAGYDYGTGIDDLDDVDVITDPPAVGETLIWDGTKWVPGIPTIGPQPFGFAFGPKTPVVSKILATFDTPVAWDMPASLTNSQGTIVDSDTATATAPSAQTDFDIQSPPGSSIATMRFAASSLTATFINVAGDSVPIGQMLYIVAPANLNGITGAISGSIKGTRP